MSEKLGEGQHSVVFKCYHLSDDLHLNPYAVKISRSDDLEIKAATRNEFEISKKISHPNILRAFELFENLLTGELL